MTALERALEESLRSTPRVSGALLSDSAANDVSGLLHSLPECFLYGGLECRLDDDDQVDVALCAERRRARPLLPGASDTYCGALLSAWLNGPEPALRDMSAAWLEFDRPARLRAEGRERSPWPDAFAFFRVAEAEARLSGLCRATLLLQALGPDFATDPRAAGDALEQALPRNASLLHLAALQHRGERELRAHVAVSARAFDEYLDVALAGEGEKRALIRYVLGDVQSTLALQLTAKGDVFRPISLELAFDDPTEAPEQWDEIFSRLVAASLASSTKAAAARAWPGTLDYGPSDVPARVRVQRFLHVTLRFEGDPSAKAYLYFYPRFVSP